MTFSVKEIVDAINTTLATATGISTSQSASSGQITESIPGGDDKPVLQTYWVDLVTDASGGTDRTTFRGGIRQTEFTIQSDIFVRQRSYIGEDLQAVSDGVTTILDVLYAQNTKPYFDSEAIKAFSWRAEYVNFTYGAPQINYAGYRFTFTVRVF